MTSSSAARATAQQLLVFIAARRSWAGGARAGLNPASTVGYLAVYADGSTESGEAEIGNLPAARNLDLVFDALDVYTATVEAPVLSDARLRQALPHLLEERMLADPADCHFAAAPAGPAAAPGDVPGNGSGTTVRLSVAAIDRTTLSRALEAMGQAQLSPRAAYSELHLLPAPADGVFGARLAQDKGLLRTGRDQGCVFDPDDAGAGALALAVRQFSIARLRIFGPQTEAGAARTAALAASLEAALAAAPASSGARARVSVEAAGRQLDLAALGGAVNLLQGAFVPSGGFGFSGRLLSRLSRDGAWKVPAAWAAVCVAIAVGGLNAYWLQLDGRFQDLRAAMHRTFRAGFPNESDAYLLEQARRSVALLRARAGRPSADDFSVLNAQALQLLASAPVGIVAGVEYTDNGYRIRFKPGSADDPSLRNALQARAPGLGLALRFDADGSAHLAPSGS
jgi:general secretion pathway protein L